MKTSGIIYHSEWESEGQSVSVTAFEEVTSFELGDRLETTPTVFREDPHDRIDTGIYVPIDSTETQREEGILFHFAGNPGRKSGDESEAISASEGFYSRRSAGRRYPRREPARASSVVETNQDSGVDERDFQEYRFSPHSYPLDVHSNFSRDPRGIENEYFQNETKRISSDANKDEGSRKQSHVNRDTYQPGATIALPKKKRLKLPRKLFGLLLFFPNKLTKKLISIKVIGFLLRVAGSLFKKATRNTKKILQVSRLGRVFRLFGRTVLKLFKGILKGIKKPVKILRFIKIKKILIVARVAKGVFKSILKLLKKTLSVFKIFKVVNKDRTSKVIKTSLKYMGKVAKASFKSTKWLTVKSIKLIPPTFSLTYKGLKKIKSNDILFRLILAAIAGAIFVSWVILSLV